MMTSRDVKYLIDHLPESQLDRPALVGMLSADESNTSSFSTICDLTMGCNSDMPPDMLDDDQPVLLAA